MRIEEGVFQGGFDRSAFDPFPDIADIVRSGFFFHPTDEDLSVGTPVGKSRAALHILFRAEPKAL
jgi:hypothetical protein